MKCRRIDERQAVAHTCLHPLRAGIHRKRQVSFVSVGNDLGLVHSVPYGPTFDFLDTSWPRDRTAILAMMQKNMGNGAAVGDYDGDGDYDLYLLGQEGQPNKLFRNDVVNGSRRYTDVSVALGVADLGGSSCALPISITTGCKTCY